MRCGVCWHLRLWHYVRGFLYGVQVVCRICDAPCAETDFRAENHRVSVPIDGETSKEGA
jgi:hypothetical protein